MFVEIGSDMAKGESTDVVIAKRMDWLIVAVDGTLDGETLTFEKSWDGTNWTTLTADGSDVTITSRDMKRLFVMNGLRVRLTLSNGAGSPTNVYVRAELRP